jgi:hypothetical protein
VQPKFSLRTAASAPPPPGRQTWVLRPDHLFDPALRLKTASTQLRTSVGSCTSDYAVSARSALTDLDRVVRGRLARVGPAFLASRSDASTSAVLGRLAPRAAVPGRPRPCGNFGFLRSPSQRQDAALVDGGGHEGGRRRRSRLQPAVGHDRSWRRLGVRCVCLVVSASMGHAEQRARFLLDQQPLRSPCSSSYGSC